MARGDSDYAMRDSNGKAAAIGLLSMLAQNGIK